MSLTTAMGRRTLTISGVALAALAGLVPATASAKTLTPAAVKNGFNKAARGIDRDLKAGRTFPGTTGARGRTTRRCAQISRGGRTVNCRASFTAKFKIKGSGAALPAARCTAKVTVFYRSASRRDRTIRTRVRGLKCNRVPVAPSPPPATAATPGTTAPRAADPGGPQPGDEGAKKSYWYPPGTVVIGASEWKYTKCTYATRSPDENGVEWNWYACYFEQRDTQVGALYDCGWQYYREYTTGWWPYRWDDQCP